MPQALYLKYRPQTFEQVEGQEHITRTLINALAIDRIAHAYLFTGPRGTGKTSTARILAKAVNCLSTTGTRPCNECAVCRAINAERLLDLIEIDAASNTGVENIRDLRDKVDFRPGEARFKVYIIDEVHMLSTSAFNALLKTLEEPPPHVIFVLATTEPNKIPATITSRCQRFDFRRATLQELIQRLGYIAEQEGLNIEPAAVELIARQATGSFRDAASLLDQLMAFGGTGNGAVVTLAQVQGLLGASSHETVHGIVKAMAERDVAVGMSLIGQAVDAGADPRQLARELVDYVRGVLLFQVGSGAALTVSAETQADLTALAALMPAEQILRAIRLLNQAAFELRGSASPTLPLEMALVETVLEPTAPTAAAPAPRRETAPRPAPGPRATSSRTPIPPEPDIPPNPAEEQDTQSSPTTDRQDKPRARTASQSSPAEKKEKQPDEPSITNSDVLTVEMVMREWQNFLARVHKLDKTLDAWLRDAKPVQVQGDLITIGVEYDLHKKKVEDAKARPQVEKALAAIFGKPYHYKCILSPRKQKLKAAANDPRVRAALEMGGQIKDIEEEKP